MNYATYGEIETVGGKRIKLFFVFNGELETDFVQFQAEGNDDDDASTDLSGEFGDVCDISHQGSTQSTSVFWD